MGKYIGNIVTDGGPTGYSCSFDGSTQYLNIADNAALQVGAGNFTIEAWVYPSSLPSAGNYKVFWSKRTSTGGYGGALLAMDSTGALQFFVASNSTTWGISGSSTGFSITTGVWQHLAMVRSGNNLILYKNGVAGTTVSLTFSVYDTGAFTLMAGSSTGGQNVDGYMSNFRLVKGTALYTAAFTPPTQLTSITNTSLLTCQQPTIIDTSSNNFTITNTGGVTVSTLTPFTAYASYTPAAGDASPGIWKQSDLARFTQNRQINMYDPYWASNTLLLNGNGTNGAQNNTFLVTPPGGVGQYSAYFDGTGSSSTYKSLSTPQSANFELYSGNNTVECWVYPTGYSGAIFCFATNVLNFYALSIDASGALVLVRDGSPSGYTQSLSTTVLSLNKWYHIAWVRTNGNTNKFFVNGVDVTSTFPSPTNSGTFPWTNTTPAVYIGVIYYNYFGTLYVSPWVGYISNFRVVKGTAVYTTNFTPPTLQLTPIPNTQLLTCQNSTFIDNSPNNYTVTNNNSVTVVNTNTYPAITRTGTVTQGTFTPYGSLWSGYFSGSSQYLTWTGTALGSGDFTVECWVNAPAVATNKSMLSSTSPNTTAGWAFYLKNGTTPSFYNNAADAVTSSVTLPNNQWVHVAAVRSGTTLTIYLNGVSVGSGTFTSNLTSNSFYVASDVYSQHLNAYISNARHVVGTAVYTSNFTPSIVPLTAITNTTALVCNSNYFRDNSTNRYAITVTGSPYTQRYSPFVQNAPYEQAYYSGSCYFNAATSYLTSASTGALGMGTGDFTLEMWLWPTAFPDDGYMLAIGASNSVTLEIRLGWVAVHLYDGAHSDFHFQDLVPNYGQWQHFAVCRVGGTIYGYLNGVKSGYSVAFSANLGTSSAATIMPAGNRVIGFASDIRVSNTALYTATFTPPTTPAVPTTSTALLVQGTNAGITDAAAGNAVTTVGNAQISTTQSKYGGASMYFDGSGDAVTLASSTQYDLGAFDFTIECWVYPTNGLQTQIICKSTDATTVYGPFAIALGSPVYFNASTSGSSWAVNITTSALTTNTWTHLAFVRSGTTFTAYVNGASVGSATASGALYVNTSPVIIGAAKADASARPFTGYIDDLRITKGVARYTANFTPPTSQLQNC